MIVLNRQPRKKEYNALIDICCEVCDEFQLVLEKILLILPIIVKF